jgi:hypothetical protein
MTTKTEASNGTVKRRKPAAKKQATVVPAAAPAEPTREEIAQLAEKFWMERGRPEGSPELDWLRAEHELRTAS